MTLVERDQALRQRAEEQDPPAAAEEWPSTSSEAEDDTAPETSQGKDTTLLEILESIAGVQKVPLEDEPSNDDASSQCRRKNSYAYNPITDVRSFIQHRGPPQVPWPATPHPLLNPPQRAHRRRARPWQAGTPLLNCLPNH